MTIAVRTHGKFLIGIFLVALVSILVYVRFSIYFDINPLIFHIAYITSIVSCSLFLVKTDSTSILTSFLLVLVWIFALMMTIPLRLPSGIISNYPDMIYESQIINNVITSSKIDFGAATAYAQSYAFNPALESLIAEVSIVLGINYEIILKFTGPFLGLLTISFLFCFYKTFLPEKDAVISAFLAGSCFHFLMFCSHTVHLSLALVYLTLLLYSLTKTISPLWRIVSITSILMIVLTHHFTSIVGAFYLLAAFIFAYLFKKRVMLKEKISFRITVLFWVISISWLSYIAFPFFSNLVQLSKTLWLNLISPMPEMRFPLFARTVDIPILIRLIGDLGIIMFGLTIAFGFFYIIVINRKMSSKYNTIIPLTCASALMFILSILIYSKYTEMGDLLQRAYIYIYFSAAPLSLLTIKKTSHLVTLCNYRKIFCAFLISLIAISAVYYSYPYYRYESKMPLDKEDVRFPLHEWRSAGIFVRDHVIQGVEIWGDKIAFNYIGGYGEVNVRVLPKELNITLIDWFFIYPSNGSIIILRKSMSNVPYLSYYVTGEEFSRILEKTNIFYTSGEVVLLKK